MRNTVREKLARGLPAIGTWNMIGHTVVAEIMAQAGFDWIGIDLEHGVFDRAQVLHQMQAVQAAPCAPFCRLPANDAAEVKWALDGGAQGVIVPMVLSAEEARQAVAYAKYPPEGIRGVGIWRAQGYGATFGEYVTTANRETMVVVQIEHIDSVHAIEAICAVPGVDAVFIGPYDLSGSMGLMGELDHPDVLVAVDHVLGVALDRGIVAGLHIAEPREGEVAARIEEGFRLIAVGLDTLMLTRAMRGLRSASG